MSKVKTSFLRRAFRVRSKIRNNAKKLPRLSVFRSGQHLYTQVIDDTKGCTVVSVSTLGEEFKGIRATVATASNIGKKTAELCKEKGISQVVFDKGGYYYHGKIKAVADGAREAGLKI
jgi:large subunit ribosomal protein L18